MNWRTNTLAEKPGHRHEHGELNEAPPGAWKPSDDYMEPPEPWWPLLVWIAGRVALVCAVGWVLREVLE